MHIQQILEEYPQSSYVGAGSICVIFLVVNIVMYTGGILFSHSDFTLNNVTFQKD